MIQTLFSLEGKTIVVTGASSGIGAQCAIDCATMGAKVILLARNQERLSDTLSKMTGEGHETISVDLSDTHSLKETVKQIVTKHGVISGVVNCAGISSVVPLKLISEEALSDMIRINVYAGLFLTKEVCRMGHYDKQGTSIVFLSSVMGLCGENAKTMYSLSKGALQSAARSLAVELAPKKIRVNCVAPGAIETPINAKQPYMADSEKRAYLETQHPLGIGKTSDISNAVIYLLSDAARWVTGQTLAVDGGYTVR